MKFEYNDGGRKEAGRKGYTGDCVCRAIVIATGLPYLEVYDALAAGNAGQRRSKHSPKKGRTASAGINVTRKWFREYMTALGFVWVPTMAIGQGCTVHMREHELPKGRLVVNVSRHCTAVIDGVNHDTYEQDRQGTRCVYGYWILQEQPALTKIQNVSKQEFIMSLFNRINGKLNIYEQAVLREMYQPNPDIEAIIATLKDQQASAPGIIEGIAGKDLAAMLEKIIL